MAALQAPAVGVLAGACPEVRGLAKSPAEGYAPSEPGSDVTPASIPYNGGSQST